MSDEKKRLELRVDPDLYARLEKARRAQRPVLSVNLFVQSLLERALTEKPEHP